MKPSRFKINSDYATLKNDGNATLSVTVPDTFQFVASDRFRAFTQDIIVGSSSAGMSATISQSKYPDKATPATQCGLYFDYQVDGVAVSGGAIGSIYIMRPSPNVARLVVEYGYFDEPNPNSIITVVNAAQTITAKINTFLSPFET